jgi:predicted nucleic acid-binding protein
METSLEVAGVSLDDVDLLTAGTARHHQAKFVSGVKNDFD